MTGQPDTIMVSRSFTLGYYEAAEEVEESMRLVLAYDLFGPNRLDRRKRKRLLRRARERGQGKFFQRFGK
jgi:hypothetical protein